MPHEWMLAASTGPSPVRLNNFYAFWPESGHPGDDDWLFRDDGTPPNPGEMAALEAAARSCPTKANTGPTGSGWV